MMNVDIEIGIHQSTCHVCNIIDLKEVKFIHCVGFLGPDCLQSYPAFKENLNKIKRKFRRSIVDFVKFYRFGSSLHIILPIIIALMKI